MYGLFAIPADAGWGKAGGPSMKSKQFFEIFNHFLATREVEQMLALTDCVEVFGSASLGDGRTYVGSQAPMKMREAIQLAASANKGYRVSIRHADIDDNHANIILELHEGMRRRKSLLSLAVKNGALTTFHESAVKM